MTLSLHFLNVGHGSSVVVEYQTADGASFGLIDSQHTGAGMPVALAKLQSLGAERLSFICLTHPHKDHYSGLWDVIQAYHGRIDGFYSYSIGEVIANTKALQALAKTLIKIERETDSPSIKRGAVELLQILRWQAVLARIGFLVMEKQT